MLCKNKHILVLMQDLPPDSTAHREYLYLQGVEVEILEKNSLKKSLLPLCPVTRAFEKQWHVSHVTG